MNDIIAQAEHRERELLAEARQKATAKGYVSEGDEADFISGYLEGFAEAVVKKAGLAVIAGESFASAYIRAYQANCAAGAQEAKQRAAAIIRCADAKGRHELALTLACETDLSPEAARAILRATPVSAPAQTGRAHADQFEHMMRSRGLWRDDPPATDDDQIDDARRRALKREGRQH